MTEMNKTWVLRHRPVGNVKETDLELVEAPLAPLQDGEVRARTIYLSLDPTHRIWMSDKDAYLPPVGLGEPMRGGGLSLVTESRFDGLEPGDIVNTGLAHWALYNTLPGATLAKMPQLPGVPLTAFMGPIGATGMTAYFGLMDIAKPKAGETVVVSAAAGAVRLHGWADRQDPGLPRCRHRGVGREVQMAGRDGRFRCRHQLQEGRRRRGARHALPEWHRHQFRECRRQDHGHGHRPPE